MNEEKFVAEKCLRFKKPANESCSVSSEDREIEECQNWVYDDSGKTIVQDVSNKFIVLKDEDKFDLQSLKHNIYVRNNRPKNLNLQYLK